VDRFCRDPIPLPGFRFSQLQFNLDFNRR
jgi:hypothetical protein